MVMIIPVGSGLRLGQGYYFEVEAVSVASGVRVGIRSGDVPADGTNHSTESADVLRVTAATAGQVVSVLVRGGFLWFAIDGVVQNSGLPSGSALTGTWRPALSLAANDTNVATARFASASWDYTPPSGFVGIGDAAVWLDENSVTLSGSDLTATAGTASTWTPVRADTGFVVMPAGFQAAITLGNLT